MRVTILGINSSALKLGLNVEERWKTAKSLRSRARKREDCSHHLNETIKNANQLISREVIKLKARGVRKVKREKMIV